MKISMAILRFVPKLYLHDYSEAVLSFAVCGQLRVGIIWEEKPALMLQGPTLASTTGHLLHLLHLL